MRTPDDAECNFQFQRQAPPSKRPAQPNSPACELTHHLRVMTVHSCMLAPLAPLPGRRDCGVSATVDILSAGIQPHRARPKTLCADLTELVAAEAQVAKALGQPQNADGEGRGDHEGRHRDVAGPASVATAGLLQRLPGELLLLRTGRRRHVERRRPASARGGSGTRAHPGPVTPDTASGPASHARTTAPARDRRGSGRRTRETLNSPGVPINLRAPHLLHPPPYPPAVSVSFPLAPRYASAPTLIRATISFKSRENPEPQKPAPDSPPGQHLSEQERGEPMDALGRAAAAASEGCGTGRAHERHQPHRQWAHDASF